MNANHQLFKTLLLLATLVMPFSVNALATPISAQEASRQIAKLDPVDSETIQPILLSAYATPVSTANEISVLNIVIKGNPTIADLITVAAIKIDSSSTSAIISAAISVAPTAAQAITTAAISYAGSDITLSNTIMSASINAILTLDANNTAVTGNIKSTTGTGNINVLSAAILDIFTKAAAACTHGDSTCFNLAKDKALSQANAAKDPVKINAIDALINTVSPN